MSDLLLTGLAVGACYALVASAVAVAAVATRTLHLAIGTVAAAGLVVVMTASVDELTGIPPVLALVAGLAVGGVLSGAVHLLAGFRRSDPTVVLVGIVVAAGLIDAVLAALGSGRSVRPQPLIDTALMSPATAAGVVAMLGALLLHAVLRWTRFGRRLRIAGASVATAERLGIRVTAIRTGAFALAGAAATLAAVLAAPLITFGPAQAAGLTIRGVAAAAIVSFGPIGAVAGGLLLGVTEILGQRLWPAAGGPFSVTVVVVGLLWLRGSEGSRQWGRSW